MNPFIAAFIVLGIIALIGVFILLFDEGLKRRGKPSSSKKSDFRREEVHPER